MTSQTSSDAATIWVHYSIQSPIDPRPSSSQSSVVSIEKYETVAKDQPRNVYIYSPALIGLFLPHHRYTA